MALYLVLKRQARRYTKETFFGQATETNLLLGLLLLR